MAGRNELNKMNEVVGILEYIVNVRRRLYKPASVSHFIWGTYCVVGGIATLFFGFWQMWMIGFVIGGFIETARATKLKYSLIGWLIAALLIAVGFWAAFKTDIVGFAPLGFGLGAFVGFFLPFTLFYAGEEGSKRAAHPWLGKVIGFLWVILLVSTVVQLAVTGLFPKPDGVFLWMNMVATAYLLMGVILNDKVLVGVGALLMLGVLVFKLLSFHPMALPIFVGLVLIGVGLYAGKRYRA